MPLPAPALRTALELRTVHVHGHDLAYAERGEGTPVVLVHGSLCDYRFFTHQLGALSRQRRVLAPSLRHFHPESWDGNGGRFSMAQHVDDVAAFLEALGEPVHLVGHSRGGSLAMYVAARCPQRVRSLAVVEGGGHMDLFESRVPAAARAAADTTELSRRALALFEQGRIDEGLQQWADAVLAPLRWTQLASAARQTLRDNAWTLKGQLGERYPHFGAQELAALRMPVLLVGGADSPARFAHLLDAIHAHLPHAERATVADSAHNLPATHPDAFNARLVAFLDAVEAAASAARTAAASLR